MCAWNPGVVPLPAVSLVVRWSKDRKRVELSVSFLSQDDAGSFLEQNRRLGVVGDVSVHNATNFSTIEEARYHFCGGLQAEVNCGCFVCRVPDVCVPSSGKQYCRLVFVFPVISCVASLCFEWPWWSLKIELGGTHKHRVVPFLRHRYRAFWLSFFFPLRISWRSLHCIGAVIILFNCIPRILVADRRWNPIRLRRNRFRFVWNGMQELTTRNRDVVRIRACAVLSSIHARTVQISDCNSFNRLAWNPSLLGRILYARMRYSSRETPSEPAS